MANRSEEDAASYCRAFIGFPASIDRDWLGQGWGVTTVCMMENTVAETSSFEVQKKDIQHTLKT